MPQARDAGSRYAWTRLAVTLALMTIGSGAMYVMAVVLPAVQAEFGVARADASLPYTLMMVGFGLGDIAMGKVADRFDVMWVVLIGACGLGAGFIAAGMASSPTGFALAHVSALFGLFQGGLVPGYAIIVREHFPAAEAGARVGTVIVGRGARAAGVQRAA